jgi:hypothetical protein
MQQMMKAINQILRQNQRGTLVLAGLLTLSALLSLAGLDLGPIIMIKAEGPGAGHPGALPGWSAVLKASWRADLRPHPGHTPLILASYMQAFYLDYFPGLGTRGQTLWLLCAVGESAEAPANQVRAAPDPPLTEHSLSGRRLCLCG